MDWHRQRANQNLIMPRVTVITNADKPNEIEVFYAWLSKWKNKLIFLPPNEGCGCYVNIFNIASSEEAIGELPSEIKSQSEWAGK
jgi:hypothetical protein